MESLRSIAPKLELTETDFALYQNKLGNWDGTIGELRQVTYTHLFMNDDDDFERAIEIYHEVEINDELSLKVEQENDEWSILEILILED